MEEITFSEIESTVNAVLKKENLKPALEMNISMKLTLKNHIEPSMSVEVIQNEKSQDGFFIRHYIISSSLDSMKFQLKQSIINNPATP